ncbi:hypothetical protein M0805_002656 [Coniferiporia weirii]|nr:hypothetical protein M0805_002656 [Coniferiporia weirii]
MEPITKRLHISGLTPQISSTDLSKRFSTFGTVTALDGPGKLDALGQPRPFAYVTLETTKGQLSKCLNLLSGTTWKGARLRIGEARPDYVERIRKEHESTPEVESTRPKKRRRLARGCIGVHTANMSPMTPAAVRSGWRTTPLGRLIRPMRMRPLRPLPSLPTSSTARVSGAQKLAAAQARRKGKKRLRPPPVRARRRLLDPEAWGSEYLKGVMLESSSGVILPERPPKTRPLPVIDGGDRKEETQLAPIDRVSSIKPRPPSPPPPTKSAPLTRSSPTPAPSAPSSSTAQAKLAEADLAQEAAQSLALLTSLFGHSNDVGQNDEDEDNWGGAESLSDIEAELPAETARIGKEAKEWANDGIEFVPRDGPVRKDKDKSKDEVKAKTKITRAEVEAEDQTMELDVPREESEGDEEEESGEPAQSKAQVETDAETEAEEKVTPLPKVQMTTLKDMFAPRAEDVGFSILGNLDLDLELDDVPDISAPPPPQYAPAAPYAGRLTTGTGAPSIPPLHIPVLDTSRPLFFPSSSSSSPATRAAGRVPPPDVLDLLRSRASGFHRTESAEAIRARWVARKVELTRDWKRRHREAVKSARRRGGGAGRD